MDNGTDKKEAYEFSIAGFKLKLNSKFLSIAIPVALTCGSGLWGAFEFYQSYRDMQKKIATYVAPDLGEFDKRLALVEETTNKTNDYTRDIKNDLKNDIRKLEKVVEQVERDAKESSRYVDKELRAQKDRTESMIKEALNNPMNGR
jgi:cell division protein FtsB